MTQPRIFDLKKAADKKEFQKIKNGRPEIIDELEEQLKELKFVKNPGLLKTADPKDKFSAESVWVHYPWRHALVNCLNEKDFKLLRSSRNKYLISDDEEAKLSKARIGVAGLNVGNPGAVCLALESEAGMKLADNDVLSVSNLNRFRAGLPDLGLNKAVLTSRQIYEINPFAKLEVFDQGISDENIKTFLLKPKIDVLVEETDNLLLKLKLREIARENRIPVVMVTGNGPNVIIDVERFDLKPDLPFLNGHLSKKVTEDIKSGPLPFEKKIKLMMDFMDKKYLHPDLVRSFHLVGSKLAGIPQLAESSFLRGAALSYVVRRIISGKEMKSGRYDLNMEKVYV